MRSHVFSVGGKGYTGTSEPTVKLKSSDIYIKYFCNDLQSIDDYLLPNNFQFSSMAPMPRYSYIPTTSSTADFIPSYLDIATGAERSVGC